MLAGPLGKFSCLKRMGREVLNYGSGLSGDFPWTDAWLLRKIYGLHRFVPQVLRYHAGNGGVGSMVSQPYAYQRHELTEPDWRRLPGWAGVSAAEWESAQWQRAHCVKNARQLRQVTGSGLAEEFFDDLQRDQRAPATMS